MHMYCVTFGCMPKKCKGLQFFGGTCPMPPFPTPMHGTCQFGVSGAKAVSWCCMG